MFHKSLKRSASAALIVGLVGAFGALDAAACPTGDPSVVFCEEFSSTSPLGAYTIVNPVGNNGAFTISIANEALVYANTDPRLSFAFAAYNTAFDYRNTLFEADLRFNTTSTEPYDSRSAISIAWDSMNSLFPERILMNLQLDDNQVVLAMGTQNAYRDRRYGLLLDRNVTYRVGLAVEEVGGMLAVKGYVNGTLVFSETEASMAIDLSILPSRLHPTFHGGSYRPYPVELVFDNAIVRERVNLACIGFEPPIGASPVTVKKNRALPFKAMLLDDVGDAITSLGSVPPVMQVMYAPTSGDSTDVTDLAVPVGLGTEGNQFVYADGKWQFNLQTKAYTAPGTYTVTMVPGNGYTIDPVCMGSFVIK